MKEETDDDDDDNDDYRINRMREWYQRLCRAAEYKYSDAMMHNNDHLHVYEENPTIVFLK